MHRREQRDHRGRLLVRGLALIVAGLSVGLIVLWEGYLPGALGVVGAALLWWEV